MVASIGAGRAGCPHHQGFARQLDRQ